MPDCGKEFIVGEEMKKDCPSGFPVCPYCGQCNVEDMVFTTDENLVNMELGCIGLYLEMNED